MVRGTRCCAWNICAVSRPIFLQICSTSIPNFICSSMLFLGIWHYQRNLVVHMSNHCNSSRAFLFVIHLKFFPRAPEHNTCVLGTFTAMLFFGTVLVLLYCRYSNCVMFVCGQCSNCIYTIIVLSANWKIKLFNLTLAIWRTYKLKISGPRTLLLGLPAWLRILCYVLSLVVLSDTLHLDNSEISLPEFLNS